MPPEKIPSGLRKEMLPRGHLGLTLEVLHNLEHGWSSSQLFCVHWSQSIDVALPLKPSSTHGVLAVHMLTHRCCHPGKLHQLIPAQSRIGDILACTDQCSWCSAEISVLAPESLCVLVWPVTVVGSSLRGQERVCSAGFRLG